MISWQRVNMMRIIQICQMTDFKVSFAYTCILGRVEFYKAISCKLPEFIFQTCSFQVRCLAGTLADSIPLRHLFPCAAQLLWQRDTWPSSPIGNKGTGLPLDGSAVGRWPSAVSLFGDCLELKETALSRSCLLPKGFYTQRLITEWVQRCHLAHWGQLRAYPSPRALQARAKALIGSTSQLDFPLHSVLPPFLPDTDTRNSPNIHLGLCCGEANLQQLVLSQWLTVTSMQAPLLCPWHLGQCFHTWADV